MDIYLVTLALGALAVTTTLVVLARLIPDEYDKGLPVRAVAKARGEQRKG